MYIEISMTHCNFNKIPGISTVTYGNTQHHLMYGQDNIYINHTTGKEKFTVFIRKSSGQSINYIKNDMHVRLRWMAVEEL